MGFNSGFKGLTQLVNSTFLFFISQEEKNRSRKENLRLAT